MRMTQEGAALKLRHARFFAAISEIPKEASTNREHSQLLTKKPRDRRKRPLVQSGMRDHLRTIQLYHPHVSWQFDHSRADIEPPDF